MIYNDMSFTTSQITGSSAFSNTLFEFTSKKSSQIHIIQPLGFINLGPIDSRHKWSILRECFRVMTYICEFICLNTLSIAGKRTHPRLEITKEMSWQWYSMTVIISGVLTQIKSNELNLKLLRKYTSFHCRNNTDKIHKTLMKKAWHLSFYLQTSNWNNSSAVM